MKIMRSPASIFRQFFRLTATSQDRAICHRHHFPLTCALNISPTATKAPNMQKRFIASAALLLALSFQATAAEPKEFMTDSGIGITMLKEGNGASPKATDTVKVHYRGTLTNGQEFDSSYKRNEPAAFPLNRVIPCWTEGVQKIKVGGKAKLVCPSNLAYGARGVPGIPPNSTLIFEVELLDIAK